MATTMDDDDDIATVIRKLIAGFESGEIRSATLRVALHDGTTETIQLGYDTDAEKDAALARLLKLLGELH